MLTANAATQARGLESGIDDFTRTRAMTQATPANTPAPTRVLSLSEATTLDAQPDHPKPERRVRGNPLRLTRNLYDSGDGSFSCGLWQCEPGAWNIDFPANKEEYFHVLEGRIRITGPTGEAREFGPGEACVIPAGFKGLFEVLAPVTKHYVLRDASVA